MKKFNKYEHIKLKAFWHVCPGLLNDGKFNHSMRDNCTSCAPFWEQYPVCPVCDKRLNSELYCKHCKIHCLGNNKPGKI